MCTMVPSMPMRTILRLKLPTSATSLQPRLPNVQKKMVWPEAMFCAFYGQPFLSLRTVLKKFAGSLVEKWIEPIVKDRRYRVCIAAAALNWRSALEMELMGI